MDDDIPKANVIIFEETTSGVSVPQGYTPPPERPLGIMWYAHYGYPMRHPNYYRENNQKGTAADESQDERTR